MAAVSTTIRLPLLGAQIEIAPGDPVARALFALGPRPIPFGCMAGHCAACTVRVVGPSGALNEPTPRELYTLTRRELEAGYRLACQLVAGPQGGDLEMIAERPP